MSDEVSLQPTLGTTFEAMPEPTFEPMSEAMSEAMFEPMFEPTPKSSTSSSAALSVASEEPRILLSSEPVEVSVPEPESPTDRSPVDVACEESGPDWRTELAAKMQNYRTRRKPRAPKYPSLQMPLQLPAEPPETFETLPSLCPEASRSSNALEPAVQSQKDVAKLGPELVEPASLATPTPATLSVVAPVPPTNLIEFPRSMESEAWDGLAEPVIEQPRILDAPELAPPEPALGGILLEATKEENPDPAVDTLVRPASIARRVCALITDAIVVGCGVALWGWLVTRITQEVPPRPQLLISAIVAAGVSWLSYQYLLMVYAGTTLGLRASKLELVALDGSAPRRKQRRWRLLASMLSATSMLLGYAWVLLDEDRLCWHDRITHTYLRVRERQPR
jgi:uncharacterized RDD family membrane protein YckC